jgi:hypothetical protein
MRVNTRNGHSVAPGDAGKAKLHAKAFTAARRLRFGKLAIGYFLKASRVARRRGRLIPARELAVRPTVPLV